MEKPENNVTKLLVGLLTAVYTFLKNLISSGLAFFFQERTRAGA